MSDAHQKPDAATPPPVSARDALLARNKRRYLNSAVNIGTDEKPLYFRWQNLSELEKSAFEHVAQSQDAARARSARVNLRIRVIIACAVDEHGRREFCDADVKSLQGTDGNLIQALSDEAMAHVGWTKADAEQMEQMEARLKNLPTTSAGGSP